jgi:hypothetical protein
VWDCVHVHVGILTVRCPSPVPLCAQHPRRTGLAFFDSIRPVTLKHYLQITHEPSRKLSNFWSTAVILRFFPSTCTYKYIQNVTLQCCNLKLCQQICDSVLFICFRRLQFCCTVVVWGFLAAWLRRHRRFGSALYSIRITFMSCTTKHTTIVHTVKCFNSIREWMNRLTGDKATKCLWLLIKKRRMSDGLQD